MRFKGCFIIIGIWSYCDLVTIQASEIETNYVLHGCVQLLVRIAIAHINRSVARCMRAVAACSYSSADPQHRRTWVTMWRWRFLAVTLLLSSTCFLARGKDEASTQHLLLLLANSISTYIQLALNFYQESR
jgi:hypothetical protein